MLLFYFILSIACRLADLVRLLQRASSSLAAEAFLLDAA
jgi:hypothetical protein